MESKLTMLPEVAGDGLGLAGRLAEPLPHLAEHVLHGVHRICKTTPHESIPENKERSKFRTNRLLTGPDVKARGRGDALFGAVAAPPAGEEM